MSLLCPPAKPGRTNKLKLTKLIHQNDDRNFGVEQTLNRSHIR